MVVSGCSGGGKSALVAELARRGLPTFPEPGRLVVEEELAGGGTALPWADEAAFAARALDLAMRFHAEAAGPLAVFDRSAVDQLAWAARTGARLPGAAAAEALRYHPTVFLVPPWPAIWEQDEARRHGLAAALAEWDDLRRAYPARGYAVEVVPRLPVPARADWLMGRLGLA